VKISIGWAAAGVVRRHEAKQAYVQGKVNKSGPIRQNAQHLSVTGNICKIRVTFTHSHGCVTTTRMRAGKLDVKVTQVASAPERGGILGGGNVMRTS